MRENILDKIFVTLLNAGFRSSDPEGEFICCLFLGSYDKNCVIYTWRKIHMTTDKLQFFFTKNASDVAVKFCSVKRGAISVMVGNLVSYIQYSAQKT